MHRTVASAVVSDKPSLAPLLELDGVEEAVAAARSAIDEVHWHTADRRGWPATGGEASVSAAGACAAIAGRSAWNPEAGEVTAPLLAGSLREAEKLGGMLSTWQEAPRQALAKMHMLAAVDMVSDPE